jgi:hypothetical protein
VIKNETVSKFEKTATKVGDKFEEMVQLALDTMIHEIDMATAEYVLSSVTDMLRDEFSDYRTRFIRCMNKAAEIIETELGS